MAVELNFTAIFVLNTRYPQVERLDAETLDAMRTG